jgi:hypothetical protein
MPLGSRYLAKKKKLSAQPIRTEISLGNVRDGLTPMLYTLNVIKPRDEVIEIEFDWHNIKDDICPITIYVKKEKTGTNG